MAYTVDDTPEVRRRVRGDLLRIVEAVREADGLARSVVLTGSFARGEGAVVEGEPWNDYDLVVARAVPGRSRLDRVARELTRDLGVHVDLAAVGTWRLRWLPGTIFWYETALRGRVLWGQDVRARIPVREVGDLDPAEGLRLLSNRAAGLLLATEMEDPDERRLQAAKALLAALDAHVLARGTFPPSQRERWNVLTRWLADDGVPPSLAPQVPWLRWAVRFKVRPSDAGARDPGDAWAAARRAVLAAVPTALRTASLPDLDAYAARDGLVDHVHFLVHRRRVPGAPLLASNPTGRVRVATLRLLRDARDGTVAPGDAARRLGSLAEVDGDPLGALRALRDATLP